MTIRELKKIINSLPDKNNDDDDNDVLILHSDGRLSSPLTAVIIMSSGDILMSKEKQ